MKGYETVSQTSLYNRMPVIIRLDGRAFHTFTKRLKHVDPVLKTTPFSDLMHLVMVNTTRELVEGVQNCVFGYTQSDEISLFLRDWDEYETQQWFGNNLQKIVSCSASLATAAFNFYYQHAQANLPKKLSDVAQFDSRAYNLPREEVANYFGWRQNDASRNSVQMLGHYHFSQKEMHGKSNSAVQDMLMLEKQTNWNDIPVWQKRGTVVYRGFKEGQAPIVTDEAIPVFTKDRDYVDQFLLTPNQRIENAARSEELMTNLMEI